MYKIKKILLIFFSISLFSGIAYAENYRLTEDGIQNLETMAFIPATIKNKDWRRYQKWLEKGNEPEAKLSKPVMVVDEKEEKVKAKMRELAIGELIKTGELPADYK